MNRMFRTSLILILVTAWSPHLNLFAQVQPVIPRLKGIAAGGTVTGNGTGVQVAGSFAYMSHSGGLEIYCVTNAAAPLRMGGAESLLPAKALKLSGRYAYLALGATLTLTNDPGAIEIVDVNDPANPVRVGHTSTLARANDICVAGNYAYVAESRRWTGSNLLGVLEIFDIATPTNPVRVAAFDTLGSATSIGISGNHLYLSDGATDVQVLDVSDPSNPQRIGIYQSDVSRNECGFEPGGPANYVQVAGNLAYSAGDNGLKVLDLSDPSHPVCIGDSFCFPIYRLHVAGPYAFAAVYNSTFNTFFLNILDISNPTNLVLVGIQNNWHPARMQVVGSLMYLATNPLSIYELTHQPGIHFIWTQDDTVTLVWDYAPGFILQRTGSLTDPQWTDVPGSGDQTGIILPVSSGNEFFRLARQ